MSQESSSGAEKVLGMLFTAICVVAIVLYRSYKNAQAQQEKRR
ncbi:hypothetical protein QSV36_03670 [Pseudomonas sp. BCRC 81390]|nr:hypothetical protein [Pseudomonas sp. BCRC 81390]MDM3884697.1 hypothetical protein [Pseudomonas sp. BCRC 81390]